HVGQDRSLAEYESGIGLVHGDQWLRQLESGKAAADFRGIQQLMRDVMLLARSQAASDNYAIGRTDVKTARDHEQVLAGAKFEITPASVGTTEQRHVCRTLGVRQADNAIHTVR